MGQGEKRIEVLGDVFSLAAIPVLSPEALSFITVLQQQFNPRRQELLERRVARQEQFDAGKLPDFLEETKHIREDASWHVAAVPTDLRKRWVEITGPASSSKMVINALNSGADCSMADSEDSEAPTWKNIIQGQINLKDAANRQLTFVDKENGKSYKLEDKIATLMYRPRGWHLEEKHVLVDGKPVSASLFDFGMYLFHNARTLLEKGSGPYFYLPKMESHLEARLWNEVFNAAQDALLIPKGSIKATVLIETLPAAFEMEEILYELREHIVGLNCGRWDYIFSFIKTLRNHPEYVLPDRSQVTMDKDFLASYAKLLIKTCHKRGAYAMGGMAAQIPIKNDPEANVMALDKIRADKIREVQLGHDGTWVAHPGLVSVARDAFALYMIGDEQLYRLREDVQVTKEDILQVPEGTITYEGLHTNISVGIQYLATWLSGTGCVPLYNLMEDAATAEISRTQLWQWLHHSAQLEDGRRITKDLVEKTVQKVMAGIRKEVGEERYAKGNYETACNLFFKVATEETLPAFLTVPAYNNLVAQKR